MSIEGGFFRPSSYLSINKGGINSMFSRKKFFFFTSIAVIVLCAAALTQLNAQSTARDIAKKYRKNVVQLTVKFSDGRTEDGFGFIVGEQGDRLYVVTAEHVVRKKIPDVEAKKITARFYEKKGDDFSAKLLNLSSRSGMDIALLEVPKPSKDYKWEKNYYHTSPQFGEQVWFIGRFRDWYVPTGPSIGAVNQEPLVGILKVDIYSVQQGTSGAPLITKDGIVGMVTEDDSQTNTISALAIETIRQIVTIEWGYPWQLALYPGSKTVEVAEKEKTKITPKPKEQPHITPKHSQESTWTDPITGMKFVLVKGGCYQMGDTFNEGQDDEKPVHEVCVDDFYMGKYEVTQGQWKKVMGSNPSYFKEGDDYPVEQVSWNDVQDFIKKLNRQGSSKFRLPTEAEWEYACREGGKKVRFGTGTNRINADIANFYALEDAKKPYSDVGQYRGKTVPAANFKSNALGLHNMSGNVWEWVEDIYNSNAYTRHAKNNPIYTSQGSLCVLRGGSWNDDPVYLRCADRISIPPTDIDRNVGFRLVRN
jgi:sulfatase modifying factor 1